jgi:hypothetical protein
MKKAGIKDPGAEVPDFVKKVNQHTYHTKDDLAKGHEAKQIDRLKSPYPDVTDAEWRKAWDDAADGKRLPKKIYDKPDAQLIVDLISRYTSDYEKRWSGRDRNGNYVGKNNPLAEKWFKEAPKYASVTYRGMDQRSRRGAIDYIRDHAQPGQILDTWGGWSHSFDRDVAAGRFGGEGRDGSILIEVRGGTSGLPIEGFTRVKREKEIIVWSKLKVLEVHETPRGFHIIAEEVGKFDGR